MEFKAFVDESIKENTKVPPPLWETKTKFGIPKHVSEIIFETELIIKGAFEAKVFVQVGQLKVVVWR